MVLRPYMQILLLLGMVLLLGAVMSTLGVITATALFDVGSVSEFSASLSSQASHPYAFLWVQAFGAIGAFILPAVVFTLMQNQSPITYFHLDKQVTGVLVLLAVGVLFFSQSLINLTSQLNEQLTIPEQWGALGEWLRNSHQQAQSAYENLLNFNSFNHMLFALFVVAVLPAIGEELIFRGGFQQLCQQWFGNRHLAIWTAAAIFSLFHFQVFYFLPRLLLGAALGYLYGWSKNLWYPIIAHFFNNAWVILFAYFLMPEEGSSALLSPEENLPTYILLLGLIGFLGFLVLFRTTAKRQQSNVA